MRRSIALLRGSKGTGWYQKFMKEGNKGFEKYEKPQPFDWNEILDIHCKTPEEKLLKRPKAFFNIRIDQEEAGRMVFELAEDVVPKTVDNFKRLVTGAGIKFPGYKGTNIHLVRKGEVVMGGDIEQKAGQGNHSSYERRYFEDENYIIPHSQRGLMSMASVGRNTNGSQFYLTLAPCDHLDGRCVGFARMVEGDEVLKKIETIFTHMNTPAKTINITDCGLIE